MDNSWAIPEVPLVQVSLVKGPITGPKAADWNAFASASPSSDRDHAAIAAGAVIRFEGRVRPNEPTVDGNQGVIVGLDYEIYEPMTTREMSRLATELAAEHGVLGVLIEHSYGVVGVGECSFLLRVCSRHRAEGIAMMDEFITRMKRQVPIWKVPCWAVEGRDG